MCCCLELSPHIIMFEMSMTKCMFAVFIVSQNMPGIDAIYHGTLAFLKSGGNITLHELMHNPSLSDTTNLYRHGDPPEQLLNDDTYFRSPLIEQWTDLEIYSVELNFYNYEGGWMGHYRFEGLNSGDMGVDFLQTEYLYSSLKLVIQTNVSYGPSIYIHKSSDKAYFSFMSIDMASNLTSLSGIQFVVSAGESLNYFTSEEGDAQHISCSSIQVSGDIIDITKVFQCTYHCLTVPNCRYYGIFTKSSSGLKRHKCVPLSAMPTSIMDDCGSECPDYRRCGREYFNVNTLTSVSADVYSMVSDVSDDLNAMQNDNIRSITKSFMINANSVVDMGTQHYINSINVRGPGTYKLLFFRDPCQDLLSSDIVQDENEYYGNGLTLATETNHTFAPVLVRCLYFNVSSKLYSRPIEVSKVTNKFLLADYLVVHAEWYKDACNVMEVMSRKDVIPDSAITISNGLRFQLDFAHDDNYTVPMESNGIVEIGLSGFSEAWIDYLTVQASENATATIEVRSNRPCTMQTSGPKSHVPIVIKARANMLAEETFDQLKASGVSKFCADNITVIIAAHKHVTAPTFSFKLELYGCGFFNKDSTNVNKCNVINLLDWEETVVEGWLEPRPHLASNALRPGGRGLMLFNNAPDVFVTISLSMYTAITVKRVILAGSLVGAMVDIGGVKQFGSISTGYPINIEFTDARDADLRISDIESDSSIDSTFVQLTVEIYVCFFASGNASTSLNVSSTIVPLLTTEVSSTTLQPSDHTVPTLPSSGPIPTTSLKISSNIVPTLTTEVSSTTLQPNDHTVPTLPSSGPIPTTSLKISSNIVSTLTTEISSTTPNQKTSQPAITSNSQSTTSEHTTSNQKTSQPAITSNSQATTSEHATNQPSNQKTSQPAITSNSQATTSEHTTPNQKTSQPAITSNSQATTSEHTTSNQKRSVITLNSQVTTSEHTTPNQKTSQPTMTSNSQATTSEHATNQPANQNRSRPAVTSNSQATTSEHATNQPQPTKRCRCWNQNKYLASEELDVVVKQLVQNLTVPVDKTAAFKRSKMSMPDERRSSAVIGAVGIACMLTVGGTVIMMDIDHILKAFNYIRSFLK